MAPMTFDTLPFDITSQIFVYCLPPEDDALPWRTDAPLLLAGICRDWRDIALATHELWNTMHLNLRPRSILKVAPLLVFWIPRAGNLPLSMSLIYKCGDDSDFYRPVLADSAALDALGNLIEHYSPHWKSIELWIPLPALIQLDSPTREFASLKKLVLNCGTLGRQNQVAQIFSKSPMLRELHMISGLNVAALALPWKRLTTLRLDNTSLTGCLKTFPLVPSLVNFTATIWTDGHTSGTMLPLPHLESLTLTLSHARGPALLTALALPALKHLELDFPGANALPSLTSLISRSPCFLRRLSVRFGPRWGTEHFKQLFLALDSLEELEVRNANPSLDMGLGLLKAQPRLLPNLRSLRIERTMSDGEDAELLADLLESRWNIPATVSLPVDSEAVIRLARLRAEGMSIRITSSHWSWFLRY
ncbi:hypothetical protein B0H19DRAFT_1102905 [Mycena capillaripes]|nr:hypothetical protein B0H19DRAFT_1102905 [Mycena capillaripes]